MTQLLAQINPGEISLAGFAPRDGRNTTPVKQTAVIYSCPEGDLLGKIAREVKRRADSSSGCPGAPARSRLPTARPRVRHGQRLLIYCGGWRRVKCNNLKQHFCNLTTRVIKLNEMRVVPWNLSNEDRLSLSGKVTIRLILWHPEAQGQPPCCAAGCLLRKLLGEQALLVASSSSGDGEPRQGPAAPGEPAAVQSQLGGPDAPRGVPWAPGRDRRLPEQQRGAASVFLKKRGEANPVCPPLQVPPFHSKSSHFSACELWQSLQSPPCPWLRASRGCRPQLPWGARAIRRSAKQGSTGDTGVLPPQCSPGPAEAPDPLRPPTFPSCSSPYSHPPRAGKAPRASAAPAAPAAASSLALVRRLRGIFIV